MLLGIHQDTETALVGIISELHAAKANGQVSFFILLGLSAAADKANQKSESFFPFFASWDTTPSILLLFH